jgi:hypothetical protein
LTGTYLCSEPEAELLRHELQCWGRIFQNLHRKVFQRPIPELSAKYGVENIRKIISCACATDEIVTLITYSLLAYLKRKDSQMTALRAIPVYMLNDDEDSWPLIEWTESDGVASLAIFHFDADAEVEEGSWLMHSAMPNDHELDNGWRNSRIDWNVGDVEDLKILFRVALHILGVMNLPVEDARTLYCLVKADDNSEIEYIPKETPTHLKYDQARQAPLQSCFGTSPFGLCFRQNKSNFTKYGARRYIRTTKFLTNNRRQREWKLEARCVIISMILTSTWWWTVYVL